MLLWLRRRVAWRRLLNRLLLARLLPLLVKLLLLPGQGHRLVQLAAGLRGGHGGALLLLLLLH